MKHLKSFFVALVCLLIPAVSMADDTPIPVEQLPAAVRTFIQKNFKGAKIIYAEKDWNSYECRLSDGTKVEFNKKGVWKNIDCKVSPVPAALIPAAIAKYVKANFPDCIITEISQERYGYEVGLSNGLDLKFSKQGAFIGMDD